LHSFFLTPVDSIHFSPDQFWYNFLRYRKKKIMAKYSKKAQETVHSALHRARKGTLVSGRSGKKVTSRKQAIAIGLSEAREKGQKVPRKRNPDGIS
jgi:hypothetical protein